MFCSRWRGSTTAGACDPRGRPPSHEPRHYARRIWVDSLTLGASNLRVIVDELGLDRVVLGSDYPFDMGADDPVRAVESAELAPAARFLGLPAP